MMKNQKQFDRDFRLFGDRLQNILVPNLSANLQGVLSKFPKAIELKDCSVDVYWPAPYVDESKYLMKDITNLLGGATGDHHRLLSGMWKSPTGELAIDQIMLIESFTDINGIADHLETVLDRVSYWGGVCQQDCVAIKIGNMMGSCMLLIPTA